MALAVAAGGALELTELARAPAQPLAVCAGWLMLAVGLELLSITGFVAVFKLVFGNGMSWRQCTVAALRGLGAGSVLPAGGLFGPAAAASSIGSGRRAPAALARSGIALVILTNVPQVLVLTAVGVILALGWTAGPHDIVRTVVPATVALALIPATIMMARARDGRAPRRSVACHRPLRRLCDALAVLRGGATQAISLLCARDKKLLGAIAYYAFDNATLLAAFWASGHSPAVSIVAMGYVVGSLGAALPLPGGFGAIEAGLVGALVVYGAPAAAAAIAVLLYRAVSLLLPMVLGAAAWGTVTPASHTAAAAAIRQPEQGTTTCIHTSSPS